MKWESVKSSIGYSVYALWNNGKKLVTLVFNASSNAARIEYAGERRVFLIRKEGFLKNKTVLRDEYGMLLGHTGSENNEDYIVFNNERFFYMVDADKEPSVTFYKQSPEEPIAVCKMAVEEKDMLIDLSGKNKLKEETKNSLLMTLCWYLFRPAMASRSAEFSIN